MKKFTYLFLAACLLTTNISYAKTYTVFDENSISVTDKTEPDSKITYTVTKEGKSASEYDGTNAMDIYVAYDETKSDSEGNYTVSFKTQLPSSVYSLTTYFENEEKREDVIYFVKKSENEAKRALISGTEDVSAFLLENKYSLGIEPALINEATAELTEKLYLKEGFDAASSDFENTKALLNKCAATASLCKGKVSLFSEHKASFGIDAGLDKWLEKGYIDSDAKETLEGYLSKDYESLSDFESDLLVATVLTTVCKADGFGYAKDILSEYQEELSVKSKYITNDVVRKLVGNRYDSLELLKKDMEKIYDDLNKGSSKGSSGGGGGGGKVSSITAPPVVVENKEEAPQTKPEGFSDISDYPWAAEAINALKELSVISGKTSTTFAPADLVTREEFVTIAMKAANFSNLYGTMEFTDVKESDWYYTQVKNAYICGVISGISETEFGSGMPVTRQDMAVILSNVLTKKGADLKASQAKEFKDEKEISEYAKAAVDVLSSLGIINGDANGSFNPKANATRAEAAKMVYGILSYIER